MKKLTAAVLAAALTLGCASTAFANEAIDDAIELNQYNFEEKEAVSGRFLNLLASYPGETATWQTEDYAFTFRSEDVPEELDHHFAQQITKVVDEELEKGEISQLVFDFSKTTFMDSSGIGMLMGRYRIVRYSGGKVTAIHVNDRVYRIMRISGIYKYIEISQETVWHQKKR